MPKKKTSRTPLGQYDNEIGDYLDGFESIPEEYRNGIGFFVIAFSALEHSLNLDTANFISDRSHDLGCRVLAPLKMYNKINFFYQLLLNFISVTGQNKKTELQKIKSRLIAINKLRNNIIHASWHTLKNDGTVRTKVITDEEDGAVSFEEVLLTPEIINQGIEEIGSLIEDLSDFSMGVWNESVSNGRS